MHIKQVVICGFKSYRDKTVVEPFDKGFNVVVGRNGSGKSNFFSAIQFVLSDDFSHLSTEQRQALIYEGAGEKLLNAYVEIIFDNTDRRVTMNEDDICLKRVIGHKTDKYYLNRNIITRKEFVSLFESAGFTHSNPFYIVKQGQIHQIATSADSKRLDLLKEVAGARTYDQRLQECIADRFINNTKLEQINGYLNDISERLQTAEKENEEFKLFEVLDKNRRTLDYIIHETELKNNKTKLTDLEKQRNEYALEQKKLATNVVKTQEQLETIKIRVKITDKELVTLKDERESLSKHHQHLLKDQVKVGLTIKDLDDGVDGDDNSKKKVEKDLSSIEKEIKLKKIDLEKIKPEFEEIKKKEMEYSAELSVKEKKRTDLYSKLARNQQFSNKKERNEWIREELRSLQIQLGDKCNQRDKLSIELSRDSAKEIDLKRKIDSTTKDLEQQRSIIDENEKLYCELKKSKEQVPTRNELWRNENTINENILSLKNDLRGADISLRSGIGKQILKGCDSVRTVLNTFLQRGGRDAQVPSSYYGLLIDNLQCDKSLYTAVEVTAGNSLFHHIVESDKIATLILKEMNAQKLPGEAVFMALNKLYIPQTEYPKGGDAVPIICKLQYDVSKHDKAMRYIFGKTLLCRNLAVATKLAKKVGLNCVTLEGDKVRYAGILTGGYYNVSRSKMTLHEVRTGLNQQILNSQRELELKINDRRNFEANINNIILEMQTCQTKIDNAKLVFDKLQGELRLLNIEVNAIKEFQSKKEQALAECKSNLASLQFTRERLELETNQELMSQLSAEEQAESEALTCDIQQLQRAAKQAISSRMKLEDQKNKIDNLLHNLNRRQKNCLEVLKDLCSEKRKISLNNYRNELANLQKQIVDINNEMVHVNTKMDAATKKLKVEYGILEDCDKSAQAAQLRFDEDANHLEKLSRKQGLLETKIEELSENFVKLGILPSENIYNRYVKMPLQSLFKELKIMNNKLKKYSHVNKKAVDRFHALSEEKEALTKEWKVFTKANEAIQGLEAVIEQRKMDVLEYTFNTISKNFSDVFQKLVPTGKGQLLMKTVDNEEGREITENDESTDIFTGIVIKVSFQSAAADMKEMKQLSGGQKSLVALTLIFAIQRCDSAPFYLFDEIDQALDPEYRKSLANMIHELSANVQFIITSFRPELLKYADKYYGVSFRNKVSHIDCVTKETAQDFTTDSRIHG